MSKPIIVTGLDIGSSKICAVLCELDTVCPDKSRILGIHTMPSRGVEKGYIADLNQAVDSVSRTLDRLSEKAGRRIENVYAGISGPSVTSQKTRGMISLSMRGREITEHDMKRCVRVAGTIRLPFEIDIIHSIVHSYTIDDQTEVKNPLGLYGSRLAVEIYVITASVNHIQNMKKVVDNCGYELKEAVFSGLADSYSLFDDEERRSNMIVIDIGSSLTKVTVFTQGVIRHVEVIPLGMSDIKACPGHDETAREITARIKERIDDFAGKGVGVKAAILAGGGSFADGMVEAFEDALAMDVKVGAVKHLKGDISPIESRSATTAIGLTRYALMEKYKPLTKQEPRNLVKSISSKVVDIFNNYF